MRRIDYATLAGWCDESGYELQDWVPQLRSTVGRVECDLSAVGVPKLTDVLDDVVLLDECQRLVWIRDWTIWNDRSQEIGLEHLNLLACNADQPEAHAYILEKTEWRKAIALLTVPALFGWDAHLFFRSGLVLVDFSHHGAISVSFAAGTENSIERLKSWCKG